MDPANHNKSSHYAEDSKEQEELPSQFDNTVSLVRNYSNRSVNLNHFSIVLQAHALVRNGKPTTLTYRLEQDYLKPMIQAGRIFCAERPISATFFAIFSTLSFGPVISFLGVSLFIITSFIMLALGGALLAAAAIIFGLCIILASVLLVILCVAAIITAFVVFSYLFFRLAILLHRDGWSGILNQTGETKQRFVFWGPAYNLLSSSTTQESVAPSQSQAEIPQHKNQPVANE